MCLSFFLSRSKILFFIIFICFLRDTKKESKIDRIIKLSLSIVIFSQQHDDETTRERTLTRFKVSKEKKKKKKKKAAQKRAKRNFEKRDGAFRGDVFFARGRGFIGRIGECERAGGKISI